MGIFFTVGEKKKRPGVYQRYENVGGVVNLMAIVKFFVSLSFKKVNRVLGTKSLMGSLKYCMI